MITIKSSAEEKSARMLRQQERVEKEREEAQYKRAEKVARLRSLRLARDVSDKKDADKKTNDKANGKANGKAAAQNSPPQFPQAHRR